VCKDLCVVVAFGGLLDGLGGFQDEPVLIQIRQTRQPLGRRLFLHSLGGRIPGDVVLDQRLHLLLLPLDLHEVPHLVLQLRDQLHPRVLVPLVLRGVLIRPQRLKKL